MTDGAGKAVDRGMSKTPETKPKPGVTKHGEAERLARQEREAAALRENLRKRKEQARARDAAAPSAQHPKGAGDEP